MSDIRTDPTDTRNFTMGMEIGLRLAVKMAEGHVGTQLLCDALTNEASRLEGISGGGNRARDGELEWQAWMVELEMQSWERVA